jgi:Tfp pilus assembly protein PilN
MSVRFNLMPHRLQMQLWHRRVLARQMAFVLIAAMVCAVALNGAYSAHVSFLEAYNATLRLAVDQIAPEYRVSQQLMRQRDDMLEKQKVLERLDARRSTSVLILNDVALALPSDIYLTRLEEDGERFRLEGKSVNNGAIVHFFEQIVRSDRLAGLVLEEIRMQDGESIAPYLFVISGEVRLVGATSVVMADHLP